MTDQTLQNLRAFAKLYGYIRFFHPSDEASSIDWDKFAVYGFEYIENAANDTELKQRLLDLFLPIAPSIDIYFTGDDFTYDLKKIIPEDTTGLMPVAWQHLGIQTNNDEIYDIYKSVRVNRIPEIKNHSAILSKNVYSEDLRGKKLKAEAGIKFELEDKDVSGDLWIKAKYPDGSVNSAAKTPFIFGKWKKYSVEIDISDDITNAEFGVSLNNEGILFVNGFTLSVFENGKWISLDITDGKFQNQETGNTPVDWNIVNSDYIYEIINFDTFDNDKACFIQSKYIKQPFEKYPLLGEFINKPISRTLSCIVPLALYSGSKGTLPEPDNVNLKNLLKELSSEKYNDFSADNKFVRLAGITKLWNVIQHSYPYFEMYEIDRESILEETINNVFHCKDSEEFLNYLQLITVKLNDGHAGAYFEKDNFKYYYPPVFLDYTEGKYVVSRVLMEDTGLLEGDIITEIDGRNVYEIAEAESKFISSATEGWRLNRILGGKHTKGEKDSVIKFDIIRTGRKINIETIRKYKFNELTEKGYYRENRPEKISELKPGIFYADLTRLKTEELDEKIPVLAEAKGVIFDVRGYPRLSPDFLCHLTTEKIYSAKWNVPQIIYPDFENIAGYDTAHRWEMEPLKPEFKGKIVFMTNAGAISYAESIMGIVEAYKLGIVVGSQTAGTNGNINTVKLPGGLNAVFTGMKVLKHDDTPHHGVGIHPDIPVKRTIKGITEKRDEFLEKALEILEN